MTHPETDSPIQADVAALDGPSTPSLYVSEAPDPRRRIPELPGAPVLGGQGRKPRSDTCQIDARRDRSRREAKAQSAYDGLDKNYTIGGKTKKASDFLYESTAGADQTVARRRPPVHAALDEPPAGVRRLAGSRSARSPTR